MRLPGMAILDLEQNEFDRRPGFDFRAFDRRCGRVQGGIRAEAVGDQPPRWRGQGPAPRFQQCHRSKHAVAREDFSETVQPSSRP